MAKPKTPSRARPWILLGALGLIVVVLLFGLDFLASRKIRQRVDDLKQDLGDWKSGLSTLRIWVPADSLEGNAANDYLAMIYVLKPPASWRTAPPQGLPQTAYSFAHAESSGLSLNVLSEVASLEAYDTPSDTLMATFEAYRGLISHARDALRRPYCKWPWDLAQGGALEFPSLLPIKQVAQLMAIEAHLANANDAVRLGIEIVAVGDDVRRFPLMLAQSTGAEIQRLGFRVIARAMAFPLERESYRLVLSRLAPLGPTLADTLRGEWLWLGARFAAMAGSPLLPREASAKERSVGLFLAVDWAREERAWERLTGAASLLPGERQRGMDALVAEWGEDATVSIPQIMSLAAALDEELAVRRCLQVAAAARMQAMDTGAYPTDATGFGDFFADSVLPTDPFSPIGEPLIWLAKDERFAVYSRGRNGADDGGEFSLDFRDLAGSSDIGIELP